jgi:hypothetical protein
MPVLLDFNVDVRSGEANDWNHSKFIETDVAQPELRNVYVVNDGMITSGLPYRETLVDLGQPLDNQTGYMIDSERIIVLKKVSD